MTPSAFVSWVLPAARQVASATGLDCRLFLVQWAIETGWAAAHSWGNPTCMNMGNINCHPCTDGGYCSCGTSGACFCCYPSLSAFAAAYITRLHNGLYPGVLAAAGSTLASQFTALGQSPWDAGHYRCLGGSCGAPGYALSQLYAEFQSLFDGAGCGSAPPPPPPNPCAGVTCDSCSTCQGGACVSACPSGWACSGGACSPPPGQAGCPAAPCPAGWSCEAGVCAPPPSPPGTPSASRGGANLLAVLATVAAVGAVSAGAWWLVHDQEARSLAERLRGGEGAELGGQAVETPHALHPAGLGQG